MASESKITIRAGNLLFEMEGDTEFVRQQVERHREHIDAILSEQARLIKTGEALGARRRGRRGRPPKDASARPAGGRRPGRQPVIIRDSKLELKPRQLSGLVKFIEKVAKGNRLGKDAAVFAIAYYLCSEIFKRDVFTAGDIAKAYHQVGKNNSAPPPQSVDVVQMLRNLAAASIGKMWVERNADGTFSLTAKGRDVGAKGQIVRPRGRRPASEDSGAATAAAAQPPKRRGRPPKHAQPATAAPRKRGRPRKNPL